MPRWIPSTGVSRSPIPQSCGQERERERERERESCCGGEMCDSRDPAIKLFGKTIPLPEPGEAPDPSPDPTPEAAGDDKDVSGETKDAKVKDPMSNIPELDSNEPASSSSLNIGNEEDTQTCTQDAKAIADPKTEHDRAGTDSTSQEKILKKPDKILPCPRCKSMDTKFCYYNNYNVNQPRHFCKNCQRYWTAGGTMRNVPVGAGRRKSKNLASHHRHLMMISDGLPHTYPDVPDSTHHQALSGGLSTPMIPLKGNGAVLNFCPEAPLHEAMASVRNIDEQKRNAEMGGENKEDPACASSVRASTHIENDPKISVHKEQNEAQGGHNGVGPTHNLPCYPGPPFVFPWNPGWSNVAAIAAGRCSSDLFNGLGNGGPNPFPWSSPPMLAAPAFCSPPIAVPLMPSSFWSYMSSWPNGTWNVPWVGSNVHLSPPLSTNSSECSGNSSPTLGKHSRDAAGLGGDGKTEKSLWVPKTLRIDDPDEAAKSSIWATLGIKPDEFVKKDGIFKAFQSKTESKGIETDGTQILHANPAALCRSQTFQEST